jgi:tRNA(Ile2) C34 agmatinyltransferase TiaS
MLCCWHCGSLVEIANQGFDWHCTSCGQSGEYTKIAKDWREGSYWNAPCRKQEETTDGSA